MNQIKNEREVLRLLREAHKLAGPGTMVGGRVGEAIAMQERKLAVTEVVCDPTGINFARLDCEAA